MGVQDVTAAGPMIKRTLVTLSHAIEAAAAQPDGDGPVVVIALFQRLPYFDRERATYARLAAKADLVVVGFVDDFRPRLSGHIHPVLLDVQEPLALEWTVVVATPRMGAFLVAIDEQTVAPGERSLEAGRLFRGRWGFSLTGARAELRRLKAELAGRIPPGAQSVIDEVSSESLRRPTLPADDRVDASMRLVVGEMEQARRHGIAVQSRLDAMTQSGDRDLASRLHTPAFLDRWVGADRTMTAGPLPVALVLVTVPALSDVTRVGSRGEREMVGAVAEALTRWLRAVDRAVRLSAAEFLLVLPGYDEAAAAALARPVPADLEQAGRSYPFVPLESISAVTVTRQRPLPLDELRKTIDWATAENLTIALLPS